MYRPQYPLLNTDVIVSTRKERKFDKYIEPITNLIYYRDNQNRIGKTYPYRTNTGVYTKYLIANSILEETI
jgi:hypothetical protein